MKRQRDNYKIRFWRFIKSCLCKMVYRHPEINSRIPSKSQLMWSKWYSMVCYKVYDEIDYQYGPSQLAELRMNNAHR